LQSHYFPTLTSLTYENEPVPPPTPIAWYPDSLAWQITVRKEVIRKNPDFRKFQNFLVCESEAGNISRQEAVSMIPPLLLDVQPHHKVIDLCAAPGSKSAQILEALNVSEVNEKGEPTWPTGLVIANDADAKRCYLMIHQLNRSPSPTYMATCYDASMFPNLRVPGTGGKDEILKFDRVLADVPCSGDGTLRKNELIWKNWTIKSAVGLHPLQIRILYRGLQMLALNGRLVYSTCSLNPLENEAVVAEILRLTNGAVEVVDSSDELPQLIRRPGMQSWKVFDANGEEMDRTEIVAGGKVSETMFSPTNEEEGIKRQLSRCIRMYPHLQDTGGFFIAVLIKKNPLGAQAVELPVPEENGQKYSPQLTPVNSSLDTPEPTSEPPTKKPKLDPSQPDFGPISSKGDKSTTIPGKEEPFVYIRPDHSDFSQIRTFYALSPSFPTTDLFARNSTGDPVRAIYITNPLVKEVIHRNPNMRLLNAGTRLFVKQPDHKSNAESLWRIHSDGLTLIDPFLGPTRVVSARVDEIWELLRQGAQFPLIRDLNPRLQEQVSKMGNGGFVIRVDPQGSEMSVPFTMPMWKSPMAVKYNPYKLRLMVSVMIQKLDKKALALRLFGRDTDAQGEKVEADGEDETPVDTEE
jgi:multisite-specific tRNA:(cytosine-C5)-methyltransferase